MNETKNRAANELRAQADQLRAKIADPAVTMSKDEVETAAEGIRSLETRANLIAGFTPAAEIERQGGDDELRAAAPENLERADAPVAARLKATAEGIRAAFGGTAGYLRALASGPAHLSAGQRRAHEALQAVRAIIGTASDASGGEYLLPLQQEHNVFSVDVLQPGVLDIATRYSIAGRTLRIPYAVQTDAAKTRPLSGIAAVAIIGEGASITEATPVFAQRVLTAYKYAAYTEIANEMLEDDFTGDLSPTVTKMIGGDVLNSMNAHMTIDGTGSSQPLGALHTNNTALLKHVRATANTIATADVLGMFAKHTQGGGQSRWFVSRAALPQLLAMQLSSGSAVTFLPSLNGAPTMQLLGIPVVVCDMLAALGTESDLALVNGGFYAAAIRRELSVESSMHFKFQTGVTAYRFIARGGGIPIPTATYAFKSPGGTKANEHSPFVTLDEAA